MTNETLDLFFVKLTQNELNVLEMDNYNKPLNNKNINILNLNY